MVLLGFAVDQVAVQSELADDRVDLAQGELRAALQPAANEAIRICGQSHFQRGRTAVVGERGAMLAGQPQQTLNASDGLGPLLPVHLLGERTGMGADFAAASQQLLRGAESVRGLVLVRNAIAAAL